jgi:hypothetical protein
MLAVMHRYKFAPEAYNLNTKKVEKGMGQYPLRPEVAESLFYLYQATGKEEYREAGRAMVTSPCCCCCCCCCCCLYCHRRLRRQHAAGHQPQHARAYAMWFCCGRKRSAV